MVGKRGRVMRVGGKGREDGGVMERGGRDREGGGRGGRVVGKGGW